MKKNICIIGTVGVPANYGGFETLVDNLLSTIGKNCTVIASGKVYKKHERVETYKNAKLLYLPISANGASSIIYDIISIIIGAIFYKKVLILGVSGAIILPFVRIFSDTTFIVNLDGLEWKRNKWNYFVKTYLKISEYLAVQFSDIIITDNMGIKKYVTERYNKRSVLIEYGGDHIKRWNGLSKEYCITVCRIEPENNIELILSAFSRVKNQKLIVVGNWSSSDFGCKLKEKYSKFKNLNLIGPIYDSNKIDELRGCAKLYIHGHTAGGTNPSLVEAINHRLPILAYDVIYNRYTLKNFGFYFKNENDLIDILEHINELNLANFQEDMDMLSLRYYNWKRISKRYCSLLNLN